MPEMPQIRPRGIPSPISYVSNAAVYRAIAEEASTEAQRLWAAARMPTLNGSFVIVFDPAAQSFRQSLIAITFASIYLEALLYLKGTEVFGPAWGSKYDGRIYEKKLQALGATDPELIKCAERLRKIRKNLVHEKAQPIESDDSGVIEFRLTQEDAVFAVGFVCAVAKRLG